MEEDTGKLQHAEIDGQKVSLNGKTLTLTKKTDLAISGLDGAATNDLALGDSLFAVITLDSSGDIDTVNNVFVIPGKNNPASLTPTNAPTATDSAQPPAEDDE